MGVAAGVDPAEASIYTGAVGVPESRLELHLTQFADMTQLDAFFSAILPERHVAWGKRFGAHVVDASPVWHVMRACPVRVQVHAPATTEAVGASGSGKRISGGGGGSGGGSGWDGEKLNITGKKPMTLTTGARGDDAVATAAGAAIESEASKVRVRGDANGGLPPEMRD